MDYIYSIILAIVQALTEFLPISSTGHLIIVHQFLPSDLLNNLTFDVILHSGTLLAIVIYFWQDIVKIFKGFFQSIIKQNLKSDFNQRLSWLIIIGSLPSVLIGFFFTSLIEHIFRSVFWVIIMLVSGGLLFIIFEKISKKNREIASLNFFDSLIIGLAQVLAFIPGVSRSGITIIAGLGRQLNRVAAAKFSFLLSLPIIFGAVIRKVTQINLSDFSGVFIFVSILGAVLAALAGYLTIKIFLKFLQNNSIVPFAIYRFILAAVLLLYFVVL